MKNTQKVSFWVRGNEFLGFGNEFHDFGNEFPHFGGNEFRPKRTKKSLKFAHSIKKNQKTRSEDPKTRFSGILLESI